MTTERRLAAALAVAAALALPARAEADCKEFGKSRSVCWHVVRKGDTLSLLGAEYYGDRDHKIFIMVANQLQHDKPLKPGKRLRIPLSQEVTANVGDTLASLAEQHLGNPERAKFLASFNNLPPDASIAAGQTVWIPLRVVHRAAGNETLEAIAAAYFGTAKRAEFLRQYNFRDRDTLRPGETIEVPIYHVSVQRAKLPPADEESEARARDRREMQALAARSLSAAGAAWRRGDFAAVKRELAQVKTEYLDTDQAVAVGVLLGAAYVAFEDADSAKAAFGKALERQPGHALRRYEWSPRVRAVWQSAGGKVGDEAPGPAPR